MEAVEMGGWLDIEAINWMKLINLNENEFGHLANEFSLGAHEYEIFWLSKVALSRMLCRHSQEEKVWKSSAFIAKSEWFHPDTIHRIRMF